MMNLTIESLLDLLKKKGIDAEIQSETGQIVFAFQVDNNPFLFYPDF